MNHSEFQSLLEKKQALWEELSSLEETIARVTSGQTTEGVEWKIYAEKREIELGEYTLLVTDLSEILDSLSVVDEEALRNLIAPFDALPTSPPKLTSEEERVGAIVDSILEQARPYIEQVERGEAKKTYFQVSTGPTAKSAKVTKGGPILPGPTTKVQILERWRTAKGSTTVVEIRFTPLKGNIKTITRRVLTN